MATGLPNALISGHGELVNASSDCFKCLLIDIFLSFTRCLDLAFRHAQGMVAAFHNVQKVSRFHLGSNALQKIRRT